MARKRPNRRKPTRGKPHAHPQGVLKLAGGGYGFVRTAEGEFFVPASKTGGAADGDVVELALGSAGEQRDGHAGPQTRRRTARVLRVVHRAHEVVVGRYEVADPFGVVVPLDPGIPYDVFTLRSDNPDIEHGAVVRVRMREYPSRSTAATGVVEEVLGKLDEGHVGIDLIVARHKLPTAFPQSALDEAAGASVDESGALHTGYADERARFAFTVDPFDARDFDDALSVEALPQGGVKLGVHIADVSHYVAWGTSLDVEARRRATSVYLADRVIPMLPEALSNGLCSLAPGQARRAFTVGVVLDAQFEVRSVDCHLGLIESKARMSYDQAQCYIDAYRSGAGWQHGAELAERQPVPFGALPLSRQSCERLYEALGLLDRFAKARAAARAAAGGIDFDGREAKVVLDEAGEPIDVVVRAKTAATSCVEEAMILANECVARHLSHAGVPGIFRVHDRPAADALAGLVPVLQEFGYDARVSLDAFLSGSPWALQAVLDASRTRPEAYLVSQLLVRAQQRAVYSAQMAEHYGLASQAYCHFTSPIRRYPDLVVHRMLRASLLGKGPTYTQECDSLPDIAAHASEAERVAEAAARESQELKLVEYMERFAGQVFEGVVSGVASYGIYVQLENTAEGLVPVRALGPEYFAFDPLAHKLVGQESGTVYRLGQVLDVRIQPAPERATKLELRLA